MSRFQMGPLDVRPLCGERIRTFGSRGTQSDRRPEQQAANGRAQAPVRTVTYRPETNGVRRNTDGLGKPIERGPEKPLQRGGANSRTGRPGAGAVAGQRCNG